MNSPPSSLLELELKVNKTALIDLHKIVRIESKRKIGKVPILRSILAAIAKS